MKRWTIKVDDDTRERLLQIQRVREDMDDVIVRLLDMWDASKELAILAMDIRRDPPCPDE